MNDVEKNALLSSKVPPAFVIVAVKDVKADEVLHPSFARNIFEAVRGFTVSAQDNNSLLARFPDDFCLVHLGCLYPDGRIESFDRPVVLSFAREFVLSTQLGKDTPKE